MQIRFFLHTCLDKAQVEIIIASDDAIKVPPSGSWIIARQTGNCCC